MRDTKVTSIEKDRVRLDWQGEEGRYNDLFRTKSTLSKVVMKGKQYKRALQNQILN